MPHASRAADPPALAVRAFGLDFPNPLGIAAGFDKNAAVAGRAAPPRLRLRRDRHGDAARRRPAIRGRAFSGSPRTRPSSTVSASTMRAARPCWRGWPSARGRAAGIVGVNVGANKDSHRPHRGLCAADRNVRAGRELFHHQRVVAQHAGPARPAGGEVARWSTGARASRRATGQPPRRPVPVLLKVAPDLSLAELDDVVGVARKHRVDGMIVGNTTISRPQSLRDRETREGNRRSVRPSAVQAVDADAGGNLRARRRRVPADRRRRHRLRRDRDCEDQSRRDACCSSTPGWSIAASAWSTRSSPTLSPR